MAYVRPDEPSPLAPRHRRRPDPDARARRRAIVEDLDPTTTLINALTASTIRGVRLPPVVETDRAGLVAALSTVGVVAPDTARVLRATDTMHLSRLYASPALVAEAREHDDLRVLEGPAPIEFEDGEFASGSPG